MSIGSSPSFSEIYNAINNSSATPISLNTDFRNVTFTDGTNTNSSSGTQLSLSQFRNKTVAPRDLILGSGTSRNIYHPVYSWYNHSDTVQVYRNSELRAIGIEGAAIGAIAWEMDSNSSYYTSDSRSNMKIWLANVSDDAGAPVDTGYRETFAKPIVFDTYGNIGRYNVSWTQVYNGSFSTGNIYNNPKWLTFEFGTGSGSSLEFFHEAGKSLAISCYSPYQRYVSNGRYSAARGSGDTKLSSHYYNDSTDPASSAFQTMTSSSYRPKVKITLSGRTLIGGPGLPGKDFFFQ